MSSMVKILRFNTLISFLLFSWFFSVTKRSLKLTLCNSWHLLCFSYDSRVRLKSYLLMQIQFNRVNVWIDLIMNFLCFTRYLIRRVKEVIEMCFIVGL